MTRFAGLAVLLLATSANAAPAELALGELQLELAPRHDFLADVDDGVGPSPDPYYRYAAFAQLTGGGHGGGDLGAGAAGAVAGVGCDVVAGSAQGRLRFDSSYAGEVSYGVCLSRVLLTLAWSGRRGIGIQPALDARRSLWAQHYDEKYDKVELAFGEAWREPNRRHAIFVTAIGRGETQQGDRTVTTLDFDFSLYRYRRLEQSTLTIEALVIHDEGLKAGTDDRGGVSTSFFPARVRYETPDRYVAAQAGIGFSGGKTMTSVSTNVNGEPVSGWTETIDSSGLPQMAIFVGDVEAGMKRDRLQWSTRLARSFYPTFDGNVAREARLAGMVSYSPGRTRRTTLTLSPFAARTRTWTREAGTSKDLSAGASLYFGRQLTRELRLDAIGQAGVSPYARLDGGLAENTLGGQVLVALSGRLTDLQH